MQFLPLLRIPAVLYSIRLTNYIIKSAEKEVNNLFKQILQKSVDMFKQVWYNKNTKHV